MRRRELTMSAFLTICTVGAVPGSKRAGMTLMKPKTKCAGRQTKRRVSSRKDIGLGLTSRTLILQ